MRTSATLVSEVPVAVTAPAVDTSHAQAVEPVSSSPVASSPVPSNRASEAIAAVKSHDLYGRICTQSNTVAAAWSAVTVS